MSDTPVLWGFSNSTYVRTVRMVLAAKGIAYDQNPINVLEGEPRSAEHRTRHPFGKVPVLDIDGLRLIETEAICRYLDETRPEPPFVPDTARGRARMGMAIGVINSYGYPALVGVAAYHLFPDFIGGQDEEARAAAIEDGRRVVAMLMQIRGTDPWIAGGTPSLADLFLGPIWAYVALTPDREALEATPGMADWWARMQALPVFAETDPEAG